jgi:hypothetical protein
MMVFGLILFAFPSIECRDSMQQNYSAADSVIFASLESGVSIGYQWGSHRKELSPFGASANFSYKLVNADLSLNNNADPFWGAGFGIGSIIQFKYRSDFNFKYKSIGLYYDVPWLINEIALHRLGYSDLFGVSFSLSREISPIPQWNFSGGITFDFVKLNAIRYLTKTKYLCGYNEK